MIRKTSSPQASKANSSLKSFLAFILQCWHTAWKLFCIEKKSLQNLTFQPLIGGKLWNNSLVSMQRYFWVKMILFGHINQFRVFLWFAKHQINSIAFDGEKFLGQIDYTTNIYSQFKVIGSVTFYNVILEWIHELYSWHSVTLSSTV